MRLVRSLALLAAVGVALAAAVPGEAQSKSFYWERYDVHLSVQPSGDLQVVERQTIRFVSGSFTFGFAAIPLEKTEGIDNVSVRDGSGRSYEESVLEQPFTFHADREGDELVIRWFFPAAQGTTLTFDLSYTVHGAVRIYDSGDKLQWIAIDNQRDFPIRAATVTVDLPRGAQLQDIDSAGVEATWQQGDEGRRVTYVAARSMEPADTFEIGVEFTHGVIPPNKPRWQAAVDAEEYYDLRVRPWVDLGLRVLSALLLIGIPALLYVVWYVRGRDPEAGPVPEYVTKPPGELPAGVLGTLLDESADIRDVVATIVDLARRGYLTIEEQETAGFAGLASKDFTFRKLEKGPKHLLPFERQVLDGIFSGARTKRRLSDLREKFYRNLPGIQSALYDEMVRHGFFKRRPDRTRSRWRTLGVLLVAGTVFGGPPLASAISSYTSAGFCLPVVSLVAALSILVVSRHMPAKTRKGAEAAARWRAFKAYLERIEKLADLKEAAALFETYLPYAIALGLNKSWIWKFSRYSDVPAPPWYLPSGGWGPRRARSAGRGVLAAPARGAQAASGSGGLQGMSDGLAGSLQSMSDGLTQLLNSTGSVLRSRPSSSGSSGGGGFGGGGFSSGGGGGGGGRGFG